LPRWRPCHAARCRLGLTDIGALAGQACRRLRRGPHEVNAGFRGEAMTEESELSNDIAAATSAFEAAIAANLAAGADRCTLAAACIWTGIKEINELVSSQSAAAALRTIADQMEQSAEFPWPERADDARNASAELHVATARALKQKNPTQLLTTQNVVGDVVDEAIDLLDRGHLIKARALLMALRASVSAGSMGR
jgi:hypothetical protein